MIKTRPETNINGYPFRLVSHLLRWCTCSDGADLILSYLNGNEESGLGFSVFSVL